MRSARLLFLGLAAGAVLAAPGQAGAANAWGPKVDDRVAAAAAADPVGTDTLNLIVAGSKPLPALQAVRGLVVTRIAPTVVAAQVQIQYLSRLVAARGVAHIAPDLPLLPDAGTFDGGSPVPYAALDNAPAAWARGYDGRGLGVAVIDSGVSAAPDFGTRLTQVVRGNQRSTSQADTYGHGSFVAGVVGGSNPAGLYRGVAPGVRIYSLKVAEDDGARTGDIVDAINWVAGGWGQSNGVRVIVIAASENSPTSYRGSLLDAAVEHAWRVGVVVVVAAGNLGPGSARFAPANDPFVISVGALDSTGLPADFSTSGFTPEGYARPDLLAPGRHVVSVLPVGSTLAAQAPPGNLVAPGYAMANGTSFAAPQVAGAAAIMLQKNPQLSPDQVKWLLMRTARAVPGSDVGALDVGAAISHADAVGAANEGVPMGNCTNPTLGGPCYTWGVSYLTKFDWAKAVAANQVATDAAATFDATTSWNATASWSATASWTTLGTSN